MAIGADDADVEEEARVQGVRARPVARPNAYSARWRETFGVVPAERTQVEVDFLRRVLPLPDFRRVLDVPCGAGRHTAALTAAGYAVQGADADPAAVDEARRAGLDAVVADMRDLAALASDFDAVVCMWASFGYFDSEGNRDALRQLAARVRPGGRVVLDVYDRLFMEAHQGERENRGVVERKQVRAGRLQTELVYPDGFCDRFQWQLYSPPELEAMGVSVGLTAVLAAAGFDERAAPSGRTPRMQIVFERRAPRRCQAP